MKTKPNKISFFHNLRDTQYFFNKTGIKISIFILPLALSFLATFFEGVSIALLFPFVRGIIEGNFDFSRNWPVMKQAIALLPPGGNGRIFLLIAAVIFITTMLKSILNYISSLIFIFTNRKYTNILQSLTFSRIINFGKLYYDRANIGYLQSLIVSYPNAIMSRLNSIKELLSTAFLTILYFLVMIKISWQITFFTLLTFPAINFSSDWLIKMIKKTSEDSISHKRLFARKIFNVLSTIPLLKVSASQKEEERAFSKINDIVTKFEFSIQKKNLLVGPIHEFVILISTFAVISLMAFMILKLKIGNISYFLIYFYVLRKFWAGATIFSKFNTSIAMIAGQTKDLLEVFDDKDKFFISEGTNEFRGLVNNIELRDLNFSYLQGLPVLKGISLKIGKGKMTAIVGPTGAGKTTIVSLLLRFYECPPGSIFFDGVDIREFNLKSLLQHISFVSQDTLLFDGTLRENIVYGLKRHISEQELVQVAEKSRLYNFIMGLPEGFNTAIGHNGVKLSGGEKQRLAIARALLKNAEVLILDEATSSLDSVTEKLIQEAIDEAISDRTAIVIAHRLSTIKKADKIIVIENGVITEEGPVNELLAKKGRFYSYWQAQKFD